MIINSPYTRITITAAGLMLLTFACHPAKKSVKSPSPVVVQNDTSAKNKTEAKPYRASNTRSSDLLHTRLEVNFDWTRCHMNAKAWLTVKPYFYSTDKLFLNAKGMEIKTVQVLDPASPVQVAPRVTDASVKEEVSESAGGQSSFVYQNDSLKISLGRRYSANEQYTVIIEYVAKPNELKSKGGSAAITEDKGLYFINPTGENPYKMPQIWTQGETQATSVWMPTIDSPNEKMTQEIFMTVENKFTTLSNGVLQDSKKNADGTRTDHWTLSEPHAPYLAMMAVGQFAKVSDTPWNNKEISYYVEKMYEAYAKEIFGNTREMIEFYSNRLGVAYPWPKYAQIAVRDYVSGAMENTSATLHGDFMVYQTSREMVDGKKGEDVIAHELFHQWFGDLVTCESWSNLSLNESFATYGEYLWNEYKYGRDAADHHHYQSRLGYMASQKEADLIRFNYNDKEEMFDAISYNKGGQILHMLRKAVGDEAFFASLNRYLENNKYKSAEIHDLRLAFEEVSGEDMNWFFDQWFLNKGRPKLNVSKTYIAGEGQVEVTVEQKQDLKDAPLYTLPIDVDVYIGGKPTRYRIMVTKTKETFRLAAGSEPQLVNFDAERQLLCDLEYKKSIPEYLFQYKNAPLFEDRLEALKELESKLNEPEVFVTFKDAAVNDKFYAVRNYALTKLDKAPVEKREEVKATLMAVYQGDKKTTVRAKALATLNKKFGSDSMVKALNYKALKEVSYSICGEALDAIYLANAKEGFEKARMFEDETGKDILFRVANIYVAQGGENELAFFRRGFNYVAGFELAGFAGQYVKLARRCSSPHAIAAAMDISGLSKGANKFIKFALLKGIKDLVSTWEGKENGLKAKLEAAKKENGPAADLEKELAQIKETKEILQNLYNKAKE